MEAPEPQASSLRPEPIAAAVPCPVCSYDLRGSAVGGVCPECGMSLAQVLPPGSTKVGHAVTSLVLGISSIVSCTLYGLPSVVCGILGLVYASRAMSAVRRGEASITGLSMAKAGRVCSIIGIVIGSLYLMGAAVYAVIVIFVIGGGAWP